MEKITVSNNLVKDTQIIYLSTQSTSGTLLNGDYKSRVEYNLHNYINFDNDDSVEYLTVSMPYACLTNSNYIINETNNKLIVNSGGGFFTYAFSPGNYNANSFMTMFKLVMGNDWDIALDSLTKKFSIKYNDVFTFSENSSIDYIIGFSTNLTATFSSNALFGGTCWNIAMPRVCNFLPTPRFYIRCDELNNGVVLSSNSTETSNILASVPNVSKNNSFIVYENNLDEFLLKNMAYDTLTISITDENNNLINFNGVSSFFAIRFNIYRKSVNKPASFRDILSKINKINPEDLSTDMI